MSQKTKRKRTERKEKLWLLNYHKSSKRYQILRQMRDTQTRLENAAILMKVL